MKTLDILTSVNHISLPGRVLIWANECKQWLFFFPLHMFWNKCQKVFFLFLFFQSDLLNQCLTNLPPDSSSHQIKDQESRHLLNRGQKCIFSRRKIQKSQNVETGSLLDRLVYSLPFLVSEFMNRLSVYSTTFYGFLRGKTVHFICLFLF